MYYAEEIQAPEVIERGIVDCRRHSNKTTWASIRAVQLEVYILQLEPQEEAKCAEHNLNKNTKTLDASKSLWEPRKVPAYDQKFLDDVDEGTERELQSRWKNKGPKINVYFLLGE